MTHSESERLERIEETLTKLSAQVEEIHRLTKESEPLLALAKRMPMFGMWKR